MQTLLSEPDQSMEDEAWSPSGISFRQKHHLHEDHVLELANLPPKLPQQSFSTGEGDMGVNGNNTHPDEYVEDNIWPTLKIPWRKRYIIVEEDRDYDMDDELPEVAPGAV
ncbi:hypothetical protein E4T56_gene19987 [Termitomyces sp. T112]|nr:hypothetical protein E4T56_gene19987 [Termitomyces sp. T112]